MNITLDDAIANGRGVERPFCCPVHDDSNASASVNVVKGLWVCYACRASGTLEGYAPSHEDILRMLDPEKRTRVYPEVWLDMFDGDHPSTYWASRYGEEVAKAFRCGTDPWTGMPTYPIRDASRRVIGVVRRNDIDPELPKYLYPAGVHASRTLGGIENASGYVKRLMLVEGMSDVMAMCEAEPDMLVLGTYGAGLHAPQVQLIHQIGPSEIVAGFDDDDAGRAATERAHHQLQGIRVIPVDWSSHGGSDAGSCPPAKRKKAVKAAANPTRKDQA